MNYHEIRALLYEQTRRERTAAYTEDVKLGDYLANNPGLVLIDEGVEPTFR